MIKRFLRNIILREKSSNEKFIAYLRKKGVEIGTDVRFFSPSNTLVDLSCPWLLSIGNNVNITHGVIILTHDWSFLKKIKVGAGEFSENMSENAYNSVSIGEDSFIGAGCIILPGSKIGKFCIVGAGAVVKGDFEDYSVIVGSPARKIKDIRDE